MSRNKTKLMSELNLYIIRGEKHPDILHTRDELIFVCIVQHEILNVGWCF